MSDHHQSTPMTALHNHQALSSSDNPLEVYASYPFNTDQSYQQGLHSVLLAGSFGGDDSTPEGKDELLRHTRVFYFNRLFGTSLSTDDVRMYETSSAYSPPETQSSQLVDNGDASPSRILTFTELKELIETGKIDQIPNNKLIPERFHDGSPSLSTTPSRKKPWEAVTSSSASRRQD